VFRIVRSIAVGVVVDRSLVRRCFEMRTTTHKSQRIGTRVALILLILGAFAACAQTASADDQAFFHEYIEPLLKSNCYDCHSHDAGDASGGLVLDSKTGWSVGGDSGPAIIPGSLDESLLWRVVNYAEPGLEMPPDGKLSDSELTLIKKWIEGGAIDPRAGVAVERKSIDVEAGRQWWSFQPLKHATPAQPSNYIDVLIAARLSDADIEPSPAADWHTLLRRVSYDLTGLPPTAEMIVVAESFDIQAYGQYVDELLASTAFGEKWGRHWLDVARYADSNGSSFNVPFHNAWRYRNWVIEAINRNMPTDDFIRKQIAGDLLPVESLDERDENFIATGYLLLGSKVLGTFDKEQLSLDVIDEQVDTLGKSLLGMTLGCARCHDHKFDPLPQADYYALAGIFASTSTLVDRIGGPKDDESDWERRGLGPKGDERLQAFLKEYRYDWVRAVRKHFEAKQQLDELHGKIKTDGSDAVAAESLETAEKKLSETSNALESLLVEMPAHAMAVRDAAAIHDLEIRIRGVASSKGPTVRRGFLQVASFEEQPAIPHDQSGRLELAEWITSPQHPLTARVFVNRVWKRLFREGLVRSVDNFGTTGELPSHPELLDALAASFIASGWDLKQLVREMVLTEAYRRSVAVADTKDPENRLFAHQNRRRLEAEEIRDTLLWLSGSLEFGTNQHVLQTLPIGDASNLGDYLNIQDNRRTIYQPVIRTLEPQVLQLFDAASNTMVTGARPRTVVAPQSLYFLNSEFVQSVSDMIGKRLLASYTQPDQDSLTGDEYSQILDQLVVDLMLTIVARPPTPQEKKLLTQYIQAQADGEPGLTSHDMLKVCQAVLGSTQFQFLD
jgi:hypothetical protein